MNNKEETNDATRLASKTGTRHYSKILRSATTGNRTALKLGLQQFNLQLVDVNHTYMCIQNVNKNSNNSALFILTDQLITTSINSAEH